MERELTDMQVRILAGMLRRRLEGRVPSEMLARLSDADLVRKHREHHEAKLALLTDMAKKSSATVQIVR